MSSVVTEKQRREIVELLEQMYEEQELRSIQCIRFVLDILGEDDLVRAARALQDWLEWRNEFAPTDKKESDAVSDSGSETDESDVSRVNTRKPIGQMLLTKCLINKDQLKQALEWQQKLSEELRIGEVLVKFGYVTEFQVLACVGEQFDIPVVDLDKIRPQVEAVDAVPRATAKMHNILPLSIKGNAIKVAIAELDVCALDNLRFILNMDVKPVLTNAGAITEAIDRYYDHDFITKPDLK